MVADKVKANMLADAQRYGWSIMGVFDPDNATPDYAYTIGLQRMGWPELICVGLPMRRAQHVVHDAAIELRDRRVLPADGALLGCVIDGYSCRLANAAADLLTDRAALARWLAEHDGRSPDVVRMLHVHWPDKAGRFPGDILCDIDVVAAQLIEEPQHGLAYH